MPSNDHDRRLLTIPEAAERLNLSVTTVRRRIWTGELPAVRVGRGERAPVRVDPDELEEFIYSPDPKESP